ncbi:MAG TPA: DUF2934 domain-containing protein [Candidatus Acidoferrales bacterium]|jgi:hypothetical protein|nr:DUF2934 domain-containing protein [Candidatus Acidoferrales bacterium]
MTDIRDLEKGKQQHLPTHEEIEQRAHEIYLRRGGQHGQDVDDWLAAEAELNEERQTATESAPAKSRSATAGSMPGFSTGRGLAK